MSARWARQQGGQQPVARPAETLGTLVRPHGQGEPLARWVRAARRLQLPHGVLVEGPRGAGKTTLLDWLTAALLCPASGPDEPCGVCRVCRLVASGMHPDVQVLRRAQDESERSESDSRRSFYAVTIDQVRVAETQLRRRPVEGRARVCAFPEADALTEEAQNALLKTLEEPGEATFLLLEASRPEALLPTVRSRVQRLRLRPLSDELLQQELAAEIAALPLRAGDVLALARGSLGMARRALTERVVQMHDVVRRALADTNQLRPLAVAQAVLEGATERRTELEAARQFLWVLRAELRARRDALASSWAGAYPAWQLEPWSSWIERTLEAERDLDLLIPPEQVVTICLLAIAEP